MSGTTGSRLQAAIAALATFAALALAAPGIAAACIEDGGGEDRGPLIGAAQINPSSFSYEGGTAVVSGEVEDDCGVQQVRGEVASLEGGLAWSFQMVPYAIVNYNTTLYRGEVQLPANHTAATVHYLAVIEAEDTNGSIEHAYAGETEVTASPLTTGLLSVRPPEQRFFGAVAVGASSTRTLVVRDGGSRGAAPIAASISTSGPPFSLRGAVGGKIDFVLDPGQSRAFAVDFAPEAPGPVAGWATVSRADRAQADLSVTLTGKGTERRRGR